jgi:ABC-type phosphate transport system substrate-binding protein
VLRILIALTVLLELAPLRAVRAQELLIVANPSVGDLAPLALKDVAAIYLLRNTAWPDGTHIIPVNREINSDIRSEFTAVVLKQDTASLAVYWNEMHFRGKLPPVIQESEPAMLAFIQHVPGAVGYISAATAPVGVRVIGHVH